VPHHWNWLIKANPLGAPLAAWSIVLQKGHAAPPVDLAVGGAWGVGLFVVGALFFMTRERDFAVRL
jgi:teichoic acid transport system permease protein